MILMSSSRRSAFDSAAPRMPIDRIGSRVLQDLVEMVVTETIPEGAFLPPEQALCDEFGVSRTVIRECIKRMQEKGLVTVSQGRGTQVQAFNEWNILDPLVFDALVRHDESLGVLDEVSVVRGTLEGIMAGEVAHAHRREDLDQIEAHLREMRLVDSDNAAFLQADMHFHLAVMAASRNRTAGTIARRLFLRARQSARWDGNSPADAVQRTLDEHERILAAMQAGDEAAARAAMEEHILGSWRRRRLPDGAKHLDF